MKQTYINAVAEIDCKVKELLEVEKPHRDETLLKGLHSSKSTLRDEYIEIAKPCNIGDKFKCKSSGGRSIVGVVASLCVFKNDVMIESYYPVVKGVKKANLAYFSVPYVEFVRL